VALAKARLRRCRVAAACTSRAVKRTPSCAHVMVVAEEPSGHAAKSGMLASVRRILSTPCLQHRRRPSAGDASPLGAEEQTPSPGSAAQYAEAAVLKSVKASPPRSRAAATQPAGDAASRRERVSRGVSSPPARPSCAFFQLLPAGLRRQEESECLRPFAVASATDAVRWLMAGFYASLAAP